MLKDNDGKVEKAGIFSIDEELHSLDKEELIDLLKDILEQKPEISELIVEWFKEKQKTSPEKVTKETSINDELLMEYWSDAREIISEFNEYGGGSEDDEDKACSFLNNISDLIKEGNISTAAKIRFLDDAFEEYNNENSGLEDAMMDVFFEICQTNEEWEYLVKKLGEHPSDWRKKLIMDIQKEHLHDDKALAFCIKQGGFVKYVQLKEYDDDMDFFWKEGKTLSTIGTLRHIGLMVVGKMVFGDRQFVCTC